MKPAAGKKRSATEEGALTSLPNIGKTTAAHLNTIGITTKEQFLSRDPYAVFAELLEKADPTLCRSALAGIVGASQGVRWHLVSKESAAEFAKRYPQHAWGKC
jgi:hypothetical protein